MIARQASGSPRSSANLPLKSFTKDEGEGNNTATSSSSGQAWKDHDFDTMYTEAASYVQTLFHFPCLWEKLIPQPHEMDDFIQHGTIAIGLLSQIFKGGVIINDSRKLPISSSQAADYSIALQHYDKALQGIRGAIAEGQSNLRKALVSCLLVFCFESIQGNKLSAAMQAKSGLSLLGGWMQGRLPTLPVDPLIPRTEETVDQELVEAFVALEAQVQQIFNQHHISGAGESRKSEQNFGSSEDHLLITANGGSHEDLNYMPREDLASHFDPRQPSSPSLVPSSTASSSMYPDLPI